MASFFKNLFRKEGDSQPVPAAPLSDNMPDPGRLPFLAETAAGNPSRDGQHQASSGPFPAASGRDMTARELAALLPPSLLRFDGISPDQPVPLPLDSLRQSMQTGRPVLRLSQIQAACPLLFQRPLRADEDMEVTLPMARVVGILEVSHPAQAAPASFKAAAPAASANPFSAVPGAAPNFAGSPFAVASVPVAALQSSPFAEAGSRFPVNAISINPFAAPELSPAPIAGSSAPAAGAQFPVAASPFAALAPPMPSPAGFPQMPAAAPFAESKPTPFGVAVSPAAPPVPPSAPAVSPFAPITAPANVQAVSPPAPIGLAGSGVPVAPPAALPPSVPSPFAAVAAPLPALASQPVVTPPPLPAATAAVASLPPLAAPQSLPIQPRPPQARIGVSGSVLPLLPSAPVGAMGPPNRSAPVPPSGSAGATVELSLRAVLRDADPARLGFAPENVPEAVRVTLPLELVSRQLATGRVEIGVPEICEGISEKFRPAFARAAADLRIIIPMSEVFHNLPESARPALQPVNPPGEHRSITTSPFHTPFAIKAEEDRGKQLLDLSATGFDGAASTPRPATLPVPGSELPPAPLPPVPPPVGALPVAAHVELPTLRPAVPTLPVQSAESPALPSLQPRPGALSRPPGSGTAPTPPRTAPRLKFVPVSPTALRPFPKPAPLPENPLPEAVPVIPAVALPADLAPLPSLPAAASLPAFPGTPPPLAQSTAVKVDAPSSSTESFDDLGESFSAASLGAEPPPRAGSAPVSLVGTLSDMATSAPVSQPLAEILPPPLPSPGSTTAIANTAGAVIPIWPPAPLPSLAPVTAPAVLETQPPVLPELPVKETLDECPSLPAPAARVVSVQTAPLSGRSSPVGSPQEDLTFGCVTDIRQLMLRAVLGTDQVLTAQDIVDCCAGLPGLKACVLLQRNTTLTSQGMDEMEAASFCSSAVKTRDSLVTLAETMGLGQGGNFTLRTDHGIRSFFLESNLCLAVWHAQPNFSGGTREKLILIAQELAKS